MLTNILEKFPNIKTTKINNLEEFKKASELFKRIGIYIFKSENKEIEFLSSNPDVKGYLKMDDVNTFRIQSHFISDDNTVETLEKDIDEILSYLRINYKVHVLKTLPEYFSEIFIGNKLFEVRKNDRNFQIGDVLFLKEWDAFGYTGRVMFVKVTFILNGGHFGIDKDYCVMSIKK